MSSSPCSCAPARSADAVNTAIRRLSAGRQVWTPEDLAALARLRAEWQAARARETAELAA